MRELDPLVDSYQYDRFRPRADEGYTLLRKVASIVKPIMRRRNWRVGVLSEFYPPEPNLLGLNENQGEKIFLRLRFAHDEKSFLPIEQVADTLLHELCHNEIGPHNAMFHNLWNQLRDEHDDLKMKGYTGEGFLGEGHRIGGRGIPRAELARRARAEAEKRAREEKERRIREAGSGQKLGGRPVDRTQDIRQVIADAAQRRIDIVKGCGSGSRAEIEMANNFTKGGHRTKAEEDDANEHAIMMAYIEMLEEEEREKYGNDYVPPSAANPLGPKAKSPRRVGSAPTRNVPSTAPRRASRKEPSNDDYWECPVCTLKNPWNYLVCDACTVERPDSVRRTSPPDPLQPAQSAPRTTTKTTPKTTGSGLLNDRPRRSAAEQLASLGSGHQGPIGWICHNCGNFMESEWWTCARCGEMKQTS